MNVWLLSVSVGPFLEFHNFRSNASSDTGAQPLVSQDGKTILAVNGEIYNHIALRAGLKSDIKFKTHSDCEVIIPLVGCAPFNRFARVPMTCSTKSTTRTSATI